MLLCSLSELIFYTVAVEIYCTYLQAAVCVRCHNKRISLHTSLHSTFDMLNTFIVILSQGNVHALLTCISINLLILYYVQHTFVHFIANSTCLILHTASKSTQQLPQWEARLTEICNAWGRCMHQNSYIWHAAGIHTRVGKK